VEVPQGPATGAAGASVCVIDDRCRAQDGAPQAARFRVLPRACRRPDAGIIAATKQTGPGARGRRDAQRGAGQ
jgi:hypothetical protein